MLDGRAFSRNLAPKFDEELASQGHVQKTAYVHKFVSADIPPFILAICQSTFPYDIFCVIAFPYLPAIKPPETATIPPNNMNPAPPVYTPIAKPNAKEAPTTKPSNPPRKTLKCFLVQI